MREKLEGKERVARPVGQSVATQTVECRMRTYVEVVQSGPASNVPKNVKPATQNQNITHARPSTRTEKEGKKKSENDVIVVNKADVRNSKHDVRISNDSLPEVTLFHDSILRGVEGKRLGQSYGFSATTTSTFTIEEVVPTMEAVVKERGKAPDAVVIHCGANNLKREDPKTAGRKLCSAVRKVAEQYPRTKIVVSRVAPTLHQELRQKRAVFNAVLTSELFQEKNIILIHHENLPEHHLRDSIHPNVRGSSILARNIGRTVRSLFWEIPKQKQRRQQERWWGYNWQNW